MTTAPGPHRLAEKCWCLTLVYGVSAAVPAACSRRVHMQGRDPHDMEEVTGAPVELGRRAGQHADDVGADQGHQHGHHHGHDAQDARALGLQPSLSPEASPDRQAHRCVHSAGYLHPADASEHRPIAPAGVPGCEAAAHRDGHVEVGGDADRDGGADDAQDAGHGAQLQPPHAQDDGHCREGEPEQQQRALLVPPAGNSRWAGGVPAACCRLRGPPRRAAGLTAPPRSAFRVCRHQVPPEGCPHRLHSVAVGWLVPSPQQGPSACAQRAPGPGRPWRACGCPHGCRCSCGAPPARWAAAQGRSL